MSKASSVDKCTLHLWMRGLLLIHVRLVAQKSVLSACRERQVVFQFLTCVTCRRLLGLFDKKSEANMLKKALPMERRHS